MKFGRYRGVRLGAVMLFLAAAMVCMNGCGSRYEAIDIEKELSSGSVQVQENRMTSAGQESEQAGSVSESQVRESTSDADSQSEEYESQPETAYAVPETTPAVPEIVLEPADETVYVIGDQVNLRLAPDRSGERLTAVDAGTELHRTGYHEEWSRVEYRGQECFIASRYVSVEKPVQPETEAVQPETAGQPDSMVSGSAVSMDSSWKYADFSKINTGTARLYRSESADRKNITVCVNAGHGTSGGSAVKTLCHPDGTPKVTGGTTGAGATTAVAVSGGMTFADGTPEAKVTLAMAKILKEKLLAAGYDVLMIRESDDVQLDNIARTVIANNRADCHIALHWDSTTSDKGAFFMSVPNIESYRSMEPVKSNWQKHNALGECLVAGLKDAGVKIFSGGAMEMDLTQTSYSTIPSVDIELGDKASDHSEGTLRILADGLVAGVNRYFGR